jgi:hypothetical protein
MKNTVNFLGILFLASCVCVVSLSCKKDKDTKSQKVLNITAIDRNSSKIVTKQLKSMEEKTFSIGCHVMSTTIFDTRNNSYGYAGCDNVYHFIDVETGVEIKQIPLLTMLNLMVLDKIRNLLIGHYYDYDESKDYVVTIDLNSGNVVSDKQFYVNGLWNGTVHFFRDVENEYVLLHPDNGLVFINPSTGNIIRTLSIETTCINNVVYDRKNNRIIGTTCIDEIEIGENHIIVIDLNTGNTLSKVLGEGMGSDFGFFADEMDYDAETNSYILVSANNEVLFFDVATGKVKERYQLDFDVTSLKVWRSEK